MNLCGRGHRALAGVQREIGAARDLEDRLFAPGAELGGLGHLARDHHSAVAIGVDIGDGLRPHRLVSRRLPERRSRSGSCWAACGHARRRPD
jgi:hypothetical protein